MSEEKRLLPGCDLVLRLNEMGVAINNYEIQRLGEATLSFEVGYKVYMGEEPLSVSEYPPIEIITLKNGMRITVSDVYNKKGVFVFIRHEYLENIKPKNSISFDHRFTNVGDIVGVLTTLFNLKE